LLLDRCGIVDTLLPLSNEYLVVRDASGEEAGAMFMRNFRYAIAGNSDIKHAPFARTVCGERIAADYRA